MILNLACLLPLRFSALFAVFSLISQILFQKDNVRLCLHDLFWEHVQEVVSVVWYRCAYRTPG